MAWIQCFIILLSNGLYFLQISAYNFMFLATMMHADLISYICILALSDISHIQQFPYSLWKCFIFLTDLRFRNVISGELIFGVLSDN
jgi:hypothetical protein